MNVIRVIHGTYEESDALIVDAPGTSLVVIGDSDVEETTEVRNTLTVGGTASVELRRLALYTGTAPITCSADATCRLEAVSLNGDRGAGMNVQDRAVVDLDRVWIWGNGRVGLLASGSSKVSATNSLFTGNGGGDKVIAGGVLFADAAELIATSCTIADNDGVVSPGAILSESSTPMSLKNVVLWNNAGAGTNQCPDCPLGSDSLAGDEDPQFEVAKATQRTEPEHYRITETSPARDRTSAGPGDPMVDYFGTTRSDGLIDSGFHELTLE